MSTVSDLCVQCGLCCDGSLFRFVPAKEAERATWDKLGLPLVVQSGQLAMPLPCRRLSGACCTVYEERPSGCRDFFCHLAAQLERNEVTFAQAVGLTREARRLVEALREHWPVEPPLVQNATTLELAGRSPSAEATRALEAVHRWLDTHLHWPDQ